MDESTTRITITICGDGGCGKSSITLRLVRSQWTHEYDPTIEDSYTLTRRIDGQIYHLSLTDTAGQEEYRGMWASSNLRSDAFLLVYDITSLSSLDQLDYFNDLIDMETETREEAHRERAKSRGKAVSREWGFVKPVKIVAGNKCDLQSQRQVPAQVGLEWARKHGCGFMETSARNTVNIEETFALIVRRVVEARRLGREGSREEKRDASGTGNQMLGTSRAATAPLTPLPNGPEKDMTFPSPETAPTPIKFGEIWKKLLCWR
jgi:GTPase KRas protein